MRGSKLWDRNCSQPIPQRVIHEDHSPAGQAYQAVVTQPDCDLVHVVVARSICEATPPSLSQVKIK